MTLYLSPGVYPREVAIDLMVPAGMTRAGAIAGHYSWGPVGEAVLIGSEETQIEVFDLPNDENFKDWFLLNEFIKESANIYAVRVAGKGSKNAIIGGRGNGFHVDLNALNGEVVSVSIKTPGLAYEVGDIVEILGGTIRSEVRVLQVGGNGDVKAIELLSTGTGYTTASDVETIARTDFYVGTDYEFEEGNLELPPVVARYPGARGNNFGFAIVRASEYYGSFFEDRFPVPPSAVITYLENPVRQTDTESIYSVPVDVLSADDFTVTYENATITAGQNPGQWKVSRDSSGSISVGELTYNTAVETFVGDGKHLDFDLENTHELDLFSAEVTVAGRKLTPRFDGTNAVPAGFFDIDPDTKKMTIGSELFVASGDGSRNVFTITTNKVVTTGNSMVTVDGNPYTVVDTVPQAGEVQLSPIANGYTFTFLEIEAPAVGLMNVRINYDTPVGQIKVILGRPRTRTSLKAFAKQTEVHALVFDSTGQISGEQNSVLERFAFLSLDPEAKREDGTSNYYARAINARSRSVRVSPNIKIFGEWLLSGGSNGQAPEADDYLNAYEVFRNARDYEATYLIDAVVNRTLSTRLLDLAAKRGDGVAFVGAPRDLSLDNRHNEFRDIMDYKLSFEPSNFGHFSFSWQYIYDRFNGKYRWIPTNATEAGMYARVHSEINMWAVPAGYNRGALRRAERISFLPDEAQRDKMTPNGINYYVRERGTGFVLLTSDTMQVKTGLFQNMHIRYLSIYCRVNIAEMLKYVIKEINDETTRAHVRNTIAPFMARVKAERGISESKVKCDDKNNTPEVVANRILKVDVYMKPHMLIDGVDLRLIFTKAGISFEEIVLA